PRRPRAPWQALRRRLADNAFSSLYLRPLNTRLTMVVAPPMPDLRYPPIRWQTVFLSTRPLAGKSVQKDACCGICATVWLKLSQSTSIPPRLSSNTQVQIATADELNGKRRETDEST